jgi:hypothetical protein
MLINILKARNYMKETIVGALIIGGLIGGAILLTNPKTHNPIHQITPDMDMVWMSDDLHMKSQDGDKNIIIKKIKKSKDGTKDMTLLSDNLHLKHQDGNKHIVIKKMRKPHGEHVFTEKSNGNFIIKMDSENPEDIDIDLDKILNEITEGASDEHDDLNINISVKVDSEGAIESLDGLTDSIIKSVNQAIEELSDNIDIQVSVKSQVSKSSDENKEIVD